MTTLAAHRRRLPRRGASPTSIVSFVDATGYPTSVAGDFTADPAAASITVGPLSAERAAAAGHRGLPHGQPRPAPARRRLRRAPVREPVGHGERRREPAARSPSTAPPVGTRPTSRSSSTPSAASRRPRVHGRRRREAAALRVVDVLPRHSPAVPDRDDRADRARRRRRGVRRLVRVGLVAARARRRLRGAPRSQHRERPVRRRVAVPTRPTSPPRRSAVGRG